MTENCGSCGAEPLPGSRFCWKCGTSIASGEAPAEQVQPADSEPLGANRCSSCGAQLLPDARFCNQCGHAVAKPLATEPPLEAAAEPVLPEADDEIYEEETIELGRTARRPRAEQTPAQPMVQPAAQAARRARAELHQRRTTALGLPFEQPRRWWLTALVALAVALVAVGGAGAVAYFLGLGPFDGNDETTQDVELVVANTGFSPSEITVQPGQDVQLRLVNNDTVRHQFVLYRDGSDSPLAQGQVVEGHGDDSMTFSPPPSGRYVFQCALHPEMKGTLIVAGQGVTVTPSRTATATATPLGSPTVTPTAVPLSIRYAIAAHIWPEPLNVRPDPSTENKELLQLSEGERLEVISGPTHNDGRNWWKVRLADGREGYMASEFLFLSYAAFGLAREDNNGVAVLAIRDADILKDGSLLLSLAFTNVSAANVRWESDVGDTTIYLTDESGNRYSSLEVGGAFGADLPQGLKPNETLTGWHRFTMPPDLLDRLSTNTLEGLGTLTLHYPNHGPIDFSLRQEAT